MLKTRGQISTLETANTHLQSELQRVGFYYLFIYLFVILIQGLHQFRGTVLPGVPEYIHQIHII